LGEGPGVGGPSPPWGAVCVPPGFLFWGLGLRWRGAVCVALCVGGFVCVVGGCLVGGWCCWCGLGVLVGCLGGVVGVLLATFIRVPRVCSMFGGVLAGWLGVGVLAVAARGGLV
jgi:hypothetical protein